jgi:hypothetical protein
MLLTPIKLTFYDRKTQEATKEFSQSVITFGMLLRASQLSEIIESAEKKEKKWWMWWEKNITKEEEQINAMLKLVVDLFDNQFTIDELRDGADVSEVVTVLRSITSRATNIMTANPTQPRRRHPVKKDTGS